MNSSPASLKARILKSFPGGGLDLVFEIGTGFTILFGTSGAGKTTLLDCLAGLREPEDGEITVSGETWFAPAGKTNVPVARRRVGYLFQDLALVPHLNVRQNVEYGLAAFPPPERRRRSEQILESFRVLDLAKRKPREISGGEGQRVALARALAADPRLLLLDEPLAALDAATKAKILDDLRAWNEAHQIPILYVTHSREEVFALGERVLVLDGGKLEAQGTPHEVMSIPYRETAAQLAAFENVFAATVVAVHEDRGTMTCRLEGSQVELETPLVRAAKGAEVRVGVRAGDILLANVPPVGLSARNVIPGTIRSIERRDVMMIAKVDCGVEVEVHLTLAAKDTLQLTPGLKVWLVVKTYSCHLMK
jgi:molybdate transport system ATP-binding protein